MSEQEIKSQDLNIDKLFEDFYIIPDHKLRLSHLGKELN